jgi:hypothetical protein
MITDFSMAVNSDRVGKQAELFDKSFISILIIHVSCSMIKTVLYKTHLETGNFPIWREASEWINSTTKKLWKEICPSNWLLVLQSGAHLFKQVNFCNTLCTV